MSHLILLLLLLLVYPVQSADDVCVTSAEDYSSVQCVNRSLDVMPVASLSRLHPAMHITTLDLSHNHIRQLTAQHTRHLSAVQVLHLQNNLLTAINSDAFVNCTQLRRLYLDHNALSSMSFVSGIRSLRELHISFNRITTLDAGGGGVLPSLTMVDLSFNSLQHFNCSSLLALQNVRTLNLSHNLIETMALDDAEVLSASHLACLDVSSNALQTLTFCPAAECHMLNLNYLDVSSNQLGAVQSSWCVSLPNMTVLIASDNPVHSLPSNTFTHCTSLCTLHLSNLLIDRLDAGVFRGLSHLRTLRLDGNSRLVALARHLFRPLDALVELDLRGCRLTTLEFLVPVSKVVVVYLADNPWHCDCAVSLVLAQLLPAVTAGLQTTVCAGQISVNYNYYNTTTVLLQGLDW